MNFLSILGLAGGVLASRKQYLTGKEAAERAESRLEDFQFQDLSADLTEEYKVPVKLQEQQLQQIAQRRADIADLARTGSVAEGAGLIAAQEQQVLTPAEQQIYGKMEQQIAQAQMLSIQDAQRRQELQEARSMAELQSLQQELAAGQQMMSSAIGDISQLVLSAGLSEALASEGDEKGGKSKTGLSKFKGSDGNINGVSGRKMLIEMGLKEQTGLGKLFSSIGGLFKPN